MFKIKRIPITCKNTLIHMYFSSIYQSILNVSINIPAFPCLSFYFRHVALTTRNKIVFFINRHENVDVTNVLVHLKNKVGSDRQDFSHKIT